jgi:hypothetical protein
VNTQRRRDDLSGQGVESLFHARKMMQFESQTLRVENLPENAQEQAVRVEGLRSIHSASSAAFAVPALLRVQRVLR